jgi:glucosamine-6-phosphate deaminase
VKVEVLSSAEEGSRAAAERLCGWLAGGEARTVMVAAGNTPLDLYRRVAERRLPLDHLEVFALDEYIGVPLDEPRNCANLLRGAVAEAWGVPPARFHTLSSIEAAAAAAVRAHEAKVAALGGLDVVVLGLGENGHLGFNEPGSDPSGAGRLLDLHPTSVEANRRWFADKYAPAKGVTSGLKTILAARRVMLLAFGPAKRAAVAAMLAGPTAECPASWLERHSDAHIFLDEAAAGSRAAR